MELSLMIYIGAGIGVGLIGLIAYIIWQNRKGHDSEFRTLLTQRIVMLEEENKRLSHEVTELKTNNAALTTELSYEKASFQEKLHLVHQAKKELENSFKALSTDALRANNQSFLELAQTTLEKFQESAKGDLETRQKAITDILSPVKETLSGVDQKLQELEKVRLTAYEGLKQQVADLVSSQKELKNETTNLVHALKTPSVRGRWGEMQLRRVVEMAGMLAHCDFYEQTSHTREEERLRPDMIIHLPGKKSIIVDAKAPLHSYLEALEAKDIETKNHKLKLHAKQVRSHILALASKAYWDKFDMSPEFVVLFLPGEIFFSAALEQDPTLIELGAENKVILATPTTLIALLRATSYGWRQESLAQNAKEISDLGQELYKRLADMGDHFSKVGKHLGNAVESYNSTLGTLERRVLVSARKFKDLSATSDKDLIEDIEPLDKMPRTLQKESKKKKEAISSISL